MTDVPESVCHSDDLTRGPLCCSDAHAGKHYLMYLSGVNAQPLVTIGMDGTVTIHKPGADKEAAEVFWRCLELHGKSLYDRIAELEAEVRAFRKANVGMLTESDPTITVNGKPTGGNMILTAYGRSSRPIPYDATPETISAVLIELREGVDDRCPSCGSELAPGIDCLMCGPALNVSP